MKQPYRDPEILAPVGNMEMCLAAIHNGAGAIYLGMPGFNARGRTVTFSLAELKEIIDLCHRYSVRVFIAFNVLIFEREIPEVIALLKDVIPLGPDAFIVQDIGLVRIIKALCPTQRVHASTQMTVTSFEAIQCTEDLELERYVLGREVSLAEMAKIRALTDKELEVFVHGALCVSYSGQCLTSERMGGRSANRGQCAQSCRLPYKLIVDGEVKDLVDERYLVSPKDLCSTENVKDLIQIGIDSFKIEGRLKSPEYVAATVQTYAKAALGYDVSEERQDLEQLYSRGFFNGWMNGVNHQSLVDARYGNHHGIEVGEVIGKTKDEVTVRSKIDIYPGDGVLFANFAADREIGAKVYEVETETPGSFKLRFSRDADLSRVARGMRVFVNSAPRTEARWHKTYTDRELAKRIPLRMIISGEIGERVTLRVDDGDNSITVRSEELIQASKNAPLSPDDCKSVLGALSGSPYELAEFHFKLPFNVFIHNKVLKALKRDAIELIDRERCTIPTRPIYVSAVEQLLQHSKSPANAVSSGELSVLIREFAQVEAIADSPCSTVYLDFEFGKEYGPALEQIRALGKKCGIATTRILKPGEMGHLDYIRRLKPDLVLVRNLGALNYFSTLKIPLVGDFSLNISNSVSADWLIGKGVIRFCPSYDLNRQQLIDLISECDGGKAEVTVHQYMPSFHMEHCVFAAFLSNGTSFRDCGKPCEKHRVELQGPDGLRHPLKPDAECRNTMFHGVPQSASRIVGELKALGVSNFRLEALYEDVATLRKKIDGYAALVQGEITAEQLFQQVGVVEKYGISEGQLYNIRRYHDRKKD